MWFFERRHDAQPGERTVNSSNPATLRQVCEEIGRPDLVETLSWALNLKPNEWSESTRNLDVMEDRIRYSVIANVMMYRGNVEQAREYFRKALQSTPPTAHWHQKFSTVIANLDDVVKIARKFWKLNGIQLPERPLPTRPSKEIQPILVANR
jgi:tetratricopeptide (TPR) repeat protein